MKTKTFNRYGWRRDHPEHSDIRYDATSPLDLPAKVDLRDQCPAVLNQGELGSCTANAIANAHLFEQMKQKAKKTFLPSRLFIYYNERLINNSIESDSGAELRDGIKTISKQGVCSELHWLYDVLKFAKKPNAKCYKEGLKHKAITYAKVSQDLPSMKHCLASGYPFVIGFSVYESFESDEMAKTGEGQLPDLFENFLGGHAVLVVGYDDKNQRFNVMNSWGEEWGDKGFFTLPYEYLCNNDLSSDFWTVRMVQV